MRLVRFGLATRFLAISATAVLALWLVLIVLFYRTGDLTDAATRLPPAQLSAMTELLAATPADERPLVLRALQSSLLSVSLAPAPTALTDGQDVSGEAEFAAYRNLAAGRLLSVRLTPPPEKLVRLRPMRRSAQPLIFEVALTNGAVLVVEARTPFLVTFFGQPAGVAAGLVGTLSALIAFVLFHREVRPLTRLAQAVDAIDPSGEPVTLPAFRSTTPEIQSLTRAFDRLQNRLRLMTRSRMALIGGIQHDVRSFATRLRLRLERLPDPEERERATADITDMINLLDNALLTSRAGVGALEEEMLDLAELIRGEVVDFRRSGLPVDLETAPPDGQAWIIGDRLALRRVIGNLVDNAIKYGKRAHVGLTVEGDWLKVAIEDEGPGFSAEDADMLLEPFVRAEPSRARATGGAGLGLAVARTLIEAQGGEIRLGKGQRGGQVTLTLPRFRPG